MSTLPLHSPPHIVEIPPADRPKIAMSREKKIFLENFSDDEIASKSSESTENDVPRSTEPPSMSPPASPLAASGSIPSPDAAAATRRRMAFISVATWLLSSLNTVRTASYTPVSHATQKALENLFPERMHRKGIWPRGRLQKEYSAAVKMGLSGRQIPGSFTTQGVFPTSLLRGLFAEAGDAWHFRQPFTIFNEAVASILTVPNFNPFTSRALATIAAEVRSAVAREGTRVQRGEHDRFFSRLRLECQAREVPMDFPFLQNAAHTGGSTAATRATTDYFDVLPAPMMDLIDSILPKRRLPMLPSQEERRRAAQAYTAAVEKKYMCELCGMLCSLMEHGPAERVPVAKLPPKVFVTGSSIPSASADATNAPPLDEPTVIAALSGSLQTTTLGAVASNDPLMSLRHIRYAGGCWIKAYGPQHTDDSAIHVCGTCGDALRKDHVPVHTPAGGFDAGKLDVFMVAQALEPLTSIERTLISPIRMYAEILILYPAAASSAQRRGGPGPGQRAFRGNVISLPHDGPQVAALLPSSGTDVRVFFVGTSVPKDALRTAIKGFVNAGRVRKWLEAFRSIGHPGYTDVPIAADIEHRVEQVMESLVASAEVLDVGEEEMRGIQIAVSDVAAARTAIDGAGQEGLPVERDEGGSAAAPAASRGGRGRGKGKGRLAQLQTLAPPPHVVHLPEVGTVSADLVAALEDGLRTAESCLLQAEGHDTGMGTAGRLHAGLMAAFRGCGVTPGADEGADADAIGTDSSGDEADAAKGARTAEPSTIPRLTRTICRGGTPISEFTKFLTLLSMAFPDLFLLPFGGDVPQTPLPPTAQRSLALSWRWAVRTRRIIPLHALQSAATARLCAYAGRDGSEGTHEGIRCPRGDQRRA